MTQLWLRTNGETRQHLYDFSMGYPIRVCNWTMPEYNFVLPAHKPKCKYCEQYQQGKRRICFAPSSPVEQK